jgi:Tetratricopeptide repeat
VLFGPMPAEDAIPRCEELLGSGAGNSVLDACVASALAGLHGMRGQFDEARRWGQTAAETYQELGLKLMRAGLSGILATVEQLAGELPAAEAELRSGFETFAEARSGSYLAHQAARLAGVLVALGRLDEAEVLLTSSASDASAADVLGSVVRHNSLARLHHARGLPAAATEAATGAVNIAGVTDAPNVRADALLTLATVLPPSHADEAAAAASTAAELYTAKGNSVGAAHAAALPALSAAR